MTICQTNFAAQKDLVPLNLMSAPPPTPRPHSSRTKNNNPKPKHCPLCSSLARSLSGWPFPAASISVMCQSDNCMPRRSRLVPSLLRLVSPLALFSPVRPSCWSVRLYSAGLLQSEALARAAPNPTMGFNPPAQCNHTANSQADGRKAIRDGRFLCN